MFITASCVIFLTRLRTPKNKSLLAAIVLTQRRGRGMHSKIHITWNNIVASRSEFKCSSSNCLRNILAWFRKLERKTKIIGMKPRDETVMFRSQNNSKISLKFCIIIKSDSQETFRHCSLHQRGRCDVKCIHNYASCEMVVLRTSNFHTVVSQSVQYRSR